MKLTTVFAMVMALAPACATAQADQRQDLTNACLARMDQGATDAYCACFTEQMLTLSEADQAFYADMMTSFQANPNANREEKRLIAADLHARHPFGGVEDYKAHLKTVGNAAAAAAKACNPGAAQ